MPPNKKDEFMMKNIVVVIVTMFLSGMAIGGTPTTIQQQQVSDTTRQQKIAVLMKAFHSTENKEEQITILKELEQLNSITKIKKNTTGNTDANIPSNNVQQNGKPSTYHVPFASSGNTIELTVANSSSASMTNVDVNVSGMPAWLHVTPETQVVESLKGHADHLAKFTFSVDINAPVKKEFPLSLNAAGVDGQSWTRKINIIVDVPAHFELFQNYPNPFNPTTTIAYALPRDAKVLLRVYNAIGQEIKTLVDEQQQAGGQSVQFDASNLPSGVYFYRLQANTFTTVKKMVVIK